MNGLSFRALFVAAQLARLKLGSGMARRVALLSVSLAIAAATSASTAGRLAMAREALAASRPEAAAAILREAVRADVSCGEAHGSLGVALASLGSEHAKEADAAFAASIALEPRDARHHVNRGLARQASGATVEALECFEAALAVDPGHSSALVYLGDALAELGELHGAAAILSRAVEVAPRCGRAWNRLGKFWHETAEYDEAQRALEIACEVAPHDAEVRHNLGVALRATGRFDEARRAMEQAAALGGARDQALAYYVAPPGTVAFGASSTPSVEAGRAPLAAVPPLPHGWRESLAAVHVSDVASAAECSALVAMAEEHAAAAGGWGSGGHHDAHPTRDLVVASVPPILAWLNAKLASTLLPLLAAQFGVPEAALWLTDAFVVKYAPDGQPGLGPHVDDSEISFTILLAPDGSFEGGGTHFDDLGVTVRPRQGQAVSHCGLLRHAGCEVTQGARYILAGFVRAQPLAEEWRSVRQHLRERGEG